MSRWRSEDGASLGRKIAMKNSGDWIGMGKNTEGLAEKTPNLKALETAILWWRRN